MREIKFRAWDKKTKKIRQVESIGFGILSPGFGGGYPVCNMKGYNIIEQKDICIHRDSPDFELMQYTGLKDKNGTEIYEGDILDFTIFDCWGNDTQYKGEVTWLEEGAEFGISPDIDSYWNLGWTIRQDDEIEVIGNIYENPKLLEGVK